MKYIPIREGAKNTVRGEGGVRFRTALLLKMYLFSNLNLRIILRKTEGGEGVMGNLRPYLRKTRGGGGGLETFLRRENEKNLRYLLTVPNFHLEKNWECCFLRKKIKN